LNGRSSIEAILEMTSGDDSDFNHWHATESGERNSHLSRLFLTYKPNRELIAHNHEVLIVDSTYKTNKFKMPLVNIIGVTPNNKNFFIGSAFMPSETVED